MSDLQRQFAKAKLAQFPPVAPEPFLEEEEEEEEELPDEIRARSDDDSSSASSASSTGTIIPTATRNLFARPNGTPTKRSLDPIPWTTYFERELFLPTESTTHHAYLTSPTGNAPLFVTHHGAGSSGLSFGVLASEIRKLLPGAGILSLDARGHGDTIVNPTSNTITSPPLDLTLPTLTTDLHAVILGTQSTMSWPTLPPFVLIGHSLGGAVVTSLAASRLIGDALLGYAVLDVVEGSAMEALASMQTYLATRPSSFASLAQGIEWHVRSRTVRNSTSARTSVPALLREESKGEGEEQTPRRWKWRTDLAATQPFWEGWFAGLSKRFLEAHGGKLLLLAGTDRLDKELTIGQMQGKYALQVFPEAGHFIHEDLPEKTAGVIVDFYRRNDRSALVLPPKVSDMLRNGRKV